MRSKLILIVDDSADNRSLLETLFKSNGWLVDTAHDGSDALFHLNESERLPDLILLDLQMPGMNGARFRNKQSRIERLKKIPVIVMSGCADHREIEKLHADGVLAKPLNVKSVVRDVSSFLQH